MFAENFGYRAMCIQERCEVSEAVCSKVTRSSKVGTGGTIGSNVCAGRVVERRIPRDTTTPARERGVGDGARIRNRRRETEQLTDPSRAKGAGVYQDDRGSGNNGLRVQVKYAVGQFVCVRRSAVREEDAVTHGGA